MFFWKSLTFSMIQQMLAIWSLVPQPFLKPAWTSGNSRFIYCWSLVPENFEHYFTNVWDECSCAVVWAFFGIAFLWDWNENWPFPVLWPLLSPKFAGILSAALSQHHLLGFQFSSVARLCPTLCDPMNHSKPGLPIHHQLLVSLQTHVHWVSDAIPVISSSVIPFSSYPQSSPASRSFQMSQLFTSGGQRTGVSALTSVLPMNTQDWSPLGWTGWISLQSKGLSRLFSNTTVQKHKFFGTQLSL